MPKITTTFFYTWTWNEIQYRVLTNLSMHKTRERLAEIVKNSPEEIQLTRGANSNLPFWTSCPDIAKAMKLESVDIVNKED